MLLYTAFTHAGLTPRYRSTINWQVVTRSFEVINVRLERTKN